MKDYYKILGVPQSATDEKIRRAYKTLARRYHPDVNPGQDSAERFKDIAEAYQVLKNADRRSKYDRQLAAYQYEKLDNRFKAYRSMQDQYERSRTQRYYRDQKRDYNTMKTWQEARKANRRKANSAAIKNSILKSVREQAVRLQTGLNKIFAGRKNKAKQAPAAGQHPKRLSVLEVPVTLVEAIRGATKKVTVETEGRPLSLNVKIPAGARNGSVVRFESKNGKEEVLCLLRVERHPMVRIENEGLIVDVPVTVHEAIAGATISVPALDEAVLVKVLPNSQSGTIIRVKGKGIPRPGGADDLLVRIMVHVPESELAVGIKEKSAELDQYYESPVRQRLPKTLLEMLSKPE